MTKDIVEAVREQAKEEGRQEERAAIADKIAEFDRLFAEYKRNVERLFSPRKGRK